MTLLLFVFSLFLAIGYAQVAYDLNVTGNISMNSQSGVVIKNVTEETKVGTNTTGTILNYVATTMTSNITLDASGSSYIIYAVQVENTDSSVYKFVNVLPDLTGLSSNPSTYTNRFIKPTILTASEVSTLFPSATNVIGLNDTLPATSTRTVYVKFDYDSSVINNGTVSSEYQDLATGLINLSFKKILSVTYVDITTTSSHPTTTLQGETFTVTFTGTTPRTLPRDLVVEGVSSNTTYVKDTNYTYSGGVLTFNNVTEDLRITNKFANVINTTATTYDYSTLTAGTSTLLTEVPGQPRVVLDSSGNVTCFEYTTPGTGVQFSSGSSFDTGVLAFGGTGYTIHLVYEMNTGSNTGKNVLSAIKKSNGNRYSGFAFAVYSATKFYFSATANATNINSTTFGTRLGDGWNTSSGDETYTFNLTYVTSPEALTIDLTPVTTGNHEYNATSTQLQYYPDSLDGATVYIGGYEKDHQKDVQDMVVHEFSITRN